MPITFFHIGSVYKCMVLSHDPFAIFITEFIFTSLWTTHFFSGYILLSCGLGEGFPPKDPWMLNSQHLFYV